MCCLRSLRPLRLAVHALVVGCLVACSTTATTPTPRAPNAASTPAPATPPAAARGLPARGDQPGVAVGVHGAVASVERHASEAALRVLQAGGNAVDAAIALAFALAVTHPSAGNIGGGGFMVLRMASGETAAIDYRETAPLSATRDMYLDAHGELTQDSVLGPRAAGVPGTVAGMWLAHERYGHTPWAQLLAPAIRLAREGHAVDAVHSQSLAQAVTRMREAGFERSARVYANPDGTPVAQGQVWKQPDLANTLEQIAQDPTSFYTGALAHQLATQMQAQGGLWTTRDLAEYRAVLRKPLRFPYLGHEVITMPLPSGGGVVLRQILFASELLDMRAEPWRSAEDFHLYIEAARRAYADRNTWLADPDFYDAPVAGLLDPAYMRARMETIDRSHATPSSAIESGNPRHESLQTTHFSVVDAAGDAVANTYTLNTGFGAKVVLDGTGVLLNDEMDDFAGSPGKPNTYGLVQGEANRIEPKKRMLSSMTPTLLLKDGQLRAVLGTPGGPTITTTVVQLVRALVDYGVPLDVAVRAPRVHEQWLPDHVFVEPDLEPAIVQGLRALGHSVVPSPFGSIGHADCIEVDPATHGYRAVADVTRGGGSALAY